MKGRLYLCATPIGNLEDATLRLIRILGEVDVVAAEDTRRTRKLLTHFNIRARLFSYHQGNEHKQTGYLIHKLEQGCRVAMVSDAGMPGISDPGYKLVQAAIIADVPVEVIPGPSSVLAALVLSGLPTARFSFEGFLPRSPGEKAMRLKALAGDDRTVVMFEAPGRVKDTLEVILEVLGDRQIALARELTKVHEQIIRGPVSRVLDRLPGEVLGEVVLVVQGASLQAGDLDAAVRFAHLQVQDGSSKPRAAASASSRFAVPRRLIYERLLAPVEPEGRDHMKPG